MYDYNNFGSQPIMQQPTPQMGGGNGPGFMPMPRRQNVLTAAQMQPTLQDASPIMGQAGGFAPEQAVSPFSARHKMMGAVGDFGQGGFLGVLRNWGR